MVSSLRHLSPLILVVILAGCAETTSWPKGKYGLPMPVSGCPKSSFTWLTGWRFQDTEDKNPHNARSSVLHVEGLVRDSSVNRSFCMKMSYGSTDTPIWPLGEFCIYKSDMSNCPRGFQDGQVTWDDEDTQNENKKGGILPEGVYDAYTSTTIEFCCSDSGPKTTAISLPVDDPFYLLAYNSIKCQQVKWALATPEWIRYDTEEDTNQDRKRGYYPYGAKGGVDGHTIHYCYYTSCKYVLNSTTGIFHSPFYPLNYPNGQLCSWAISALPNQTIQLRFTQFSLVKTTQGDVLEIYDGNDDNARMIGSYHGDSSPDGVRSTSNHLFVVFRSDSAWNDKGFRAEYQAVNDQEPSTTTTTTTVVTSEYKSPEVTSSSITMTSFSTTLSSNKTSKLKNSACSQEKVTEVPVASIVVPVLVCLAAVIVVATVLFWRWREMHKAKDKNPSMRYQASAVENLAYTGAILINTTNPETDRSSIVLKDEEKEDIYQEVNEQQDNPLYESTDQEPIITGNVLYDSVATKFHEED